MKVDYIWAGTNVHLGWSWALRNSDFAFRWAIRGASITELLSNGRHAAIDPEDLPSDPSTASSK